MKFVEILKKIKKGWPQLLIQPQKPKDQPNLYPQNHLDQLQAQWAKNPEKRIHFCLYLFWIMHLVGCVFQKRIHQYWIVLWNLLILVFKKWYSNKFFSSLCTALGPPRSPAPAFQPQFRPSVKVSSGTNQPNIEALKQKMNQNPNFLKRQNSAQDKKKVNFDTLGGFHKWRQHNFRPCWPPPQHPGCQQFYTIQIRHFVK